MISNCADTLGDFSGENFDRPDAALRLLYRSLHRMVRMGDLANRSMHTQEAAGPGRTKRRVYHPLMFVTNKNYHSDSIIRVDNMDVAGFGRACSERGDRTLKRAFAPYAATVNRQRGTTTAACVLVRTKHQVGMYVRAVACTNTECSYDDNFGLAFILGSLL